MIKINTENSVILPLPPLCLEDGDAEAFSCLIKHDFTHICIWSHLQYWLPVSGSGVGSSSPGWHDNHKSAVLLHACNLSTWREREAGGSGVQGQLPRGKLSVNLGHLKPCFVKLNSLMLILKHFQSCKVAAGHLPTNPTASQSFLECKQQQEILDRKI